MKAFDPGLKLLENGNVIQVEPDSGSDTYIMDEHQFKKLQEKALNATLKQLV